MESRIGSIAIVVDSREITPQLNAILSEYASVIIGRMGVPYREKNLSIMSLIVDGDTDSIGALTGKLGNLPGVRVKTALTRP